MRKETFPLIHPMRGGCPGQPGWNCKRRGNDGGTDSFRRTGTKKRLETSGRNGIFTAGSKNRAVKRLTIWNPSVKILPRTAMKRPSNCRTLRKENPRKVKGGGSPTANTPRSRRPNDGKQTVPVGAHGERPLQRRNEAVFARGRRIRGSTAKCIRPLSPWGGGIFLFWNGSGRMGSKREWI